MKPRIETIQEGGELTLRLYGRRANVRPVGGTHATMERRLSRKDALWLARTLLNFACTTQRPR